MLQSFFRQEGIEAGCDEAGRGCLAGPVVAAAVILPKEFQHADLNDSKKLNKKQRDQLRLVIEKEALFYAVSFVYQEKIDQVNILNASILAMHQALDQLKIKPELILVDGNRFKPYEFIPHICVVKGDSKFASIAAASVLAKTYRDEYMQQIHQKHPLYKWNVNKGYPTKAHRAAIALNGITQHHRKTFKLLAEKL